MATRGAVLREPSKALDQVFRFHGPKRYEVGANEFNGATTLIEHSDDFEKACSEGLAAKCIADIHGPGAVYAWFVGSPRAFLFGFTKSKQYASRRMAAVLRREFEAATGRKAQ